MSPRPDPRQLARAARDLLPPGGRQRYVARRTLGPDFPTDGEIYRDLSRFSLLLGQVRRDRSGRAPRVHLLLPTSRPAEIFAGAKTALSFGADLAQALDRPLTVATVNPRSGEPGATLDGALTPAGLPAVPVCRLGDGDALPFTDDDLWIATQWTTAHALDIACRVGLIDPERVVYLVQDYEPGFVPWSTDYAIIRATYHAGFRLVVNSRPLARHLEQEEGIAVDDALVIEPHLPVDRLEQVAAQRRPGDPVGVFFYARPGKPRNLYPLGVATLRRTGQLLGPDARRMQVMTAGEPHAAFSVPGAPAPLVGGQTGWDGYFDLLARVQVGLSLMYSPHPSHPPLELAISGARGITNRFGTSRDDLHPRLVATEADPEALAVAVAEAVRSTLDEGPGAFEPLAPGSLGRPLSTVVERVAGLLDGVRS